MVTIKVDAEGKGVISAKLHSHFVEVLGGCVYDGIWVGEDSSIPNVRGIRKDFLDAMKNIRPPVIRWPGGCYADTYHWRNGIGPRNQRPVTFNENFGTFQRDTNQFGTQEFMDLCRLTGAQPWLNINMLSGTVAEMKEWMEYCNREEDTCLKKERERNGSGEAFHVEYWGIGNEPWAGGGNFTAQGYSDEYRRFSSAVPSFKKSMTDVPAHPLKLIVSGPDGNKPKERVAWTKDLFKAFSDYRCPPMYGYDLHFYNWNVKHPEDTDVSFDRDGWNRVIDSCFELEDVISEQYELLREGLSQIPGSPDEGAFAQKVQCELYVGEWGNWHGSAFMARPALFQQVTMRDAVTTALTLDIFHRNCDKVKMACVAQTVNVLNALFLTDGDRFIKTPNYDVFEMYMVHRDAELLSCSCSGGCEEGSRIYTLASEKDGIISVNVVNGNYDQDEDVTIILPGAYTWHGGKLLCSQKPQDCNTWDDPDRIRAKNVSEPEYDGHAWHVKAPAASVGVYRFKFA